MINLPIMAAAVLLATLAHVAPAKASTYQVVINTTALAGTAAQLALDFIDGGPPGNNVSIAGFSTNGTLGNQSTTGGVFGTLPGPVMMTDSDFFNELLADITLGTTLFFLFTPSISAPDPGSVPDSFSAFLLNPISGMPLFATTDPTGANALFQFDSGGTEGGVLNAYFAPQGPSITVAQVPEPTTTLLAILGIGALYFLRRRSR